MTGHPEAVTRWRVARGTEQGGLGQPEVQALIFHFPVLLGFLMSSSFLRLPLHCHVPRDVQILPVCKASHSGGGICGGWHLAMETVTGLSPAQ